MHVDKTQIWNCMATTKCLRHNIYRIRDILLIAEGSLFKRSGVESAFPLVHNFGYGYIL